jgi:DNA processing protein
VAERLLELIAARVPFCSQRWKGKTAKADNPQNLSADASTARRNLIESVENDDDLFRLTVRDIERLSQSAIKPEWNMEKAVEDAKHDLFLSKARLFSWVSIRDEAYPPLLKEIFDPPAVLFYAGTLPDPEKPMIGMVGTRHPQIGGAYWAWREGRVLGRAGVAVVSGLALGVDAASHRGNLDGGGKTVAVLGSGVDMIYPQSNRSLGVRILEEGGAIMSELPPGTEPARWNFPARNRIITGLSRAVIVVEAPEKSGALITASYARDENRDLYAARGDGGEALGAGTAALAADGVKLIDSAAVILDEWGVAPPAPVRRWTDDDRTGRQTNMTKAAKLAASMARELGLEQLLDFEG